MCELCRKGAGRRVLIGGRYVCEECVDAARQLPPRACTLEQAQERYRSYTRDLLDRLQRRHMSTAKWRVIAGVPTLVGEQISLQFFLSANEKPFSHILRTQDLEA